MKRLQFIFIAALGLVFTFLGASFNPATWVHRTIATLLCGVLSFNSVCAVNLLGDRAFATTPPVTVAQRSSEFDTAPTTSSPTNNPSVPAYPSQVSPNTPPRPDFDDATQDAAQNAANDLVRSSQKLPMYSFYINGIQTAETGYGSDKLLVEKLLQSAGVNPPKLYTDTYNFSSVENARKLKEIAGKLDEINHERNSRWTNPIIDYVSFIFKSDEARSWVADLMESLDQAFLKKVTTADGKALVSQVVTMIEDADKAETEKAQKTCEKSSKAKFIIVAHSQGNYFANEIGASLNPEIAKRTIILGFSTFTDYSQARGKGVQVKAISRDRDISILAFIPLKAVSTTMSLPIPTISNLPSLPNTPGFEGTVENHSLENYLGSTKPEYETLSRESFAFASETLSKLVDFDAGNYKEKEACSTTNTTTTAISNAATNAASEVKQFRNCRVGKFMPDGAWNPGLCVIQGSVITAEGLVDGKSACGTCNLYIGDLPPHKGSCETRPVEQPGIRINLPIPLPGLSGPNLNTPVPCPANWDSGW